MNKQCAVGGCTAKYFCKGFCQRHYKRNAMYGDPLGGPPLKSGWGAGEAFIREHVNDPHSDDDPCVIWPFTTGRPRIRLNGYLEHVTRVLLTLRDGQPPTLLHEAAHGPCHNERCIVHVRWATPVENAADKLRDGTDNRGDKHYHRQRRNS